MIVTINTNQGIDWNAKGVTRRLQNINNALNTYRYEVAYDRTFGRDPANHDKPMDKYIQAVIAETYNLVPEIDAKAKALNVIPQIQDDGELSLKVVLELE
ncbi:MAG: hypothetical protein QHH06_10275 [Clostridiales bacterium]|jgi:hypothetical protein|nr:hypothetical protein [Eubacteriales bacterium]MDH7566851.1 hypothetical protein [Clostridiales bacterium]